MSYIISISLASFFTVFLLGFQSLNVNQGYRVLACVTSLGISASNYVLFKLLPNQELQPFEFFCYSLSGSLGILASMELHKLMKSKLKT